jgi:transcriptional regulator with XRE-family HTH domain
MSESFGARLRQRRERQQVALTTIAAQTKIKVSLLEGLERDDMSHWPVGIFRRAFIRSYAHAIGLEPNEVLREFLTLHPDPIDEAAAAFTEMTADGAKEHARPPTRFRFLVDSAIESLSRGRDAAGDRRSSAVDDPGVADGAAAIAAINSSAAVAPARFEPDLLAVAHLCTELSRADNKSEVAALLPEAARVLDAVGLVIWVWDSQVEELRPALAHGYPDTMLARLPTVKSDADNATAAAFRSARTCVVDGSDRVSGALVAPLVTPEGCVGVLAIEVQNGSEQTGSVRAVLTIVAAQVARWIQTERSAGASPRRLA